MPDRRSLATARTGDLVRLGEVDALVLCAVQDRGRSRLALMVEGRDILQVRKVLRATRDVEAVVYTTNGSKGGSFRLDRAEFAAITLAVLPVELAETLLVRARSAAGLSAEDRARLVAYVSAYFRSPLRLTGGKGPDAPAATAERRAELDHDLAAAGWRPPDDMLERLALADPWIGESLLPPEGTGPETEPGLTAFFVRERAVAKGFLPRIGAAIAELGFEALADIVLDAEAAEAMRRSSRGGNWGTGPFPVSGGPPRHMILAFDAFPVRPGASILRLHPLLDNARALDAKTATRDVIAAATPPRERFNPLHSSDHSTEAWRIAEKLLPGPEFAAMKAGVAARRLALCGATGRTALEAGRNLTAACLRRDGAVRRVFRPHLAGHGPSVVQAQGLLRPFGPEVCDILGSGEGLVDVADPGETFAPAATLGGPLPFALAVRLRALLGEAATAGIVLDRWDPAQSVFVNRERTGLRLLGFDRARCIGAPQGLSATLSDPGTRADLARLTGIPTSVFLGGSAVRMRLSRDVLRPVATLLRRFATTVSRLAFALRTRLLRGG